MPGNCPDNLRKLYLVRWKEGGVAIVTASVSDETTLDIVASPKPLLRSSVDSIHAIAGFEMRVADDAANSAPVWYRLRLGRKEV